MTRFLVSAAITTVGLSLPQGADAQSACGAASYRLYNSSFEGPRVLGGCRTEPLPGYNLGLPWMNPRGTGMDDPWRPPHKWPQTRYPVIPAYTRSSYGYYETSWRTIPIANSMAANPAPSSGQPPAPPQAAPPQLPSTQQVPAQQVPATQPLVPQAPNQQGRPQKAPVVAPTPGVNPAPPPQASPSIGPPKAAPPQIAPPQAMPPQAMPPQTTPPKTVPPKTAVPAPVPGQKPQRPPEAAPAVPAPTPGFGETMPNDAQQHSPARMARAAPAAIETPEIEVQAF